MKIWSACALVASCALGLGAFAGSAMAAPWTFGGGILSNPSGVAVGTSGDVYVADSNNNRIVQFTGSGALVRTWAHSFPTDVTTDSTGVYAAAATYGVGSGNGEVAKYTLDGATKLWSYITPGSSSTQHIATNGSLVYVSANNDRKIRVLDATTGALTGTWSMPEAVSGGIAIRPGGGLYVYDWAAHRIVRVSASGSVDGTLATLPVRSGNYYLAVDDDGRVFVETSCADSRPSSSFLVYSSSGALLNAFDKSPGEHPAGCMSGFAIGSNGNLYAAQNVLGQIKVYDLAKADVTLSATDERPLTGRQVTFRADASVRIGSVTGYEWDLDGDGSFERDGGSSATLTTSFAAAGGRTVSVKVTATGGKTAVASINIEALLAPPSGEPGVSINDAAQFTNDPNVLLWPVWPAGATAMRVSNDGGFRGAQTLALGETAPWALVSSGEERLPKTVYLRFSGSGIDEARTYQDDIILDQTRPKIVSATAMAAGARASEMRAEMAKRKKTRARTVRVRIKATDALSGVGKMQVTDSKQKPGAVRGYAVSATLRTTKKAIFVRAQDRAGNWSAWRSVRVKAKSAR